jgi:diamine N-acetyltransferase
MEWMVLDWNTPAIRFYRKLNATWMKEWMLFRIDL